MLIGLMKRIRAREGQSMTEYAMIVAAVAVVAMVAFQRFGTSLTAMVNNLANLL